MADESLGSPAGTVESTTCCVVGGGPAGVVLAYLLARDGLNVTLLESHKDFDREFRGDTFHANSMELVEDIGLMPQVDEIIRSRLKTLSFTSEDGREIPFANFSRLNSKYPYVAVISQAEFLDLLVNEAKKFPGFRVIMQAVAQELIEEGGRVAGVRYSHAGQQHELRAPLVVGADGRGSKIRAKANIELESNAPMMDIVWFRFDRKPDEPNVDGVEIKIRGGNMMVQVSRGDSWQFGLVILKGGGHNLREAGLGAFQETIRPLIFDFLKDRVTELDAWNKTTTLSVQVGRVKKWYKPGLLLIGDAAHVMSPIGGVGINYAIQDAVAAFNLLSRPLKTGNLTVEDLAAVQERREKPTAFMQKVQTGAQEYIVKRALDPSKKFNMPLPLRIISKIPILRGLPPKIFAYGIRPERVQKSAVS